MTAHFTHAEARRLVGSVVRCRFGLVGVPPGMIGDVVDVDEHDGRRADEWEIVVLWRRNGRPWIRHRGQLPEVEGLPLRDWFTREEAERGLARVDMHDDVAAAVITAQKVTA